MKEFNMLVWLTQLGLSVAAPLAGFTLLGLWLRNRFGLGVWVVITGVALGFISAVSGLAHSLRAMEKMDRQGKSEDRVVSFNEHE